MSWLSAALDRNGLGGLNKIGGPLVKAAGTAASVIPGIGPLISAGNAVGDYIPDVFSGTKLPSIAALGGKDGKANLDTILGLAGVANSAYLGDKANNYAKNAIENVDRDYAAKAPLRAAGIAGMQAAPRTLPALGAIRSRNPFAG